MQICDQLDDFRLHSTQFMKCQSEALHLSSQDFLQVQSTQETRVLYHDRQELTGYDVHKVSPSLEG